MKRSFLMNKRAKLCEQHPHRASAVRPVSWAFSQRTALKGARCQKLPQPAARLRFRHKPIPTLRWNLLWLWHGLLGCLPFTFFLSHRGDLFLFKSSHWSKARKERVNSSVKAISSWSIALTARKEAEFGSLPFLFACTQYCFFYVKLQWCDH